MEGEQGVAGEWRGVWKPGESAVKSPDTSTPHPPAPPSSGPDSCSSVFSAYFYIFNISLSAGLLPNYCILDYASSSSQIKTIPAPHTKCPVAPCVPPTTTAMAFPFSHIQTLNKRARTHCLPFLTYHSHSRPPPVPAFPRQIQTKLTNDHHCRIPNRLFNQRG